MRNYASPLNGPGNSISLSHKTSSSSDNIATANEGSSSNGAICNNIGTSYQSRLDEHRTSGRPVRRNGLEIPLDVLFLIFMECDARSLITCRLVCRHFDGFITTQKPLLYKLALYFECQVDCPRSHTNCRLTQDSHELALSISVATAAPVASASTTTAAFDGTGTATNHPTSHDHPPLSSHQKLQRLRRQSLAWRGALPAGLKSSIPVTRSDSIYELNGGIFALGDVSHMDGWVIQPNGEVNSTRGVSLDFVRLPSIIAGTTEPEWTHINIGEKISIVDFTMDVEQDLLVLIEQKFSFNGDQRQAAPYRLHLLSLSLSTNTLTQHPLAIFPAVEYPCHPDWWEYQLVLNIYGDHLGLLFSSGRAPSCGYDRIVVWDWKTGQASSMHAQDDVFESFVLLGEGHLVLPSVTTTSLDVYSYTFNEYRLGHGLHRSPGVRSPHDPTPPGSMSCIMKFKLPAVQAGLAYGYILARSQPTGRPTSSKDLPSERCTNPSYPSQQSNVSCSLPGEGESDNNNSKENIFAHYHPPFAPSIDDSIIVISIHIGRTAEDPNPNHPLADHSNEERELKDSDGTLIVKRSMLRKWLAWEDERKRSERVDRMEPPTLKTAELSLNHGPRETAATQEDESVFVDSTHVSQSVQTVPETTLEGLFWAGQPNLLNLASLLPGRNIASASSSTFPQPYLWTAEERVHMVQQLSRIAQFDQVSWLDELTQYTAPSTLQPVPGPSEVPWYEWMHQTRWLRDMGSPRWVRDVHGTRVATRVTERPRERSPVPIPVPAIPHPSDQQPTDPPGNSVGQAQGQIQGHTPFLPLPHLPSQLQDQGQGQSQVQIAGNGMVFFQPHINETRAKTRIYDFNNLPSIRVPETIPYPINLKLSLTADVPSSIHYSNADASIGPNTSALASANVGSSTGTTRAQARARALSDMDIDRGWSIIRPEDGQEWIRRPVWDDTVIAPGVTFAEEICTSLPYLEITNTSWTDCTGLMIDAERIIGMKTDEHGNLVSLEVLTM